MGAVDFLRTKLSTSVKIHEVEDGFGDFEQSNLPGDRTVVLEFRSPMGLGQDGNMFFAVTGNTVFVPEAWESHGALSTDDTGIIDALVQEGYNVKRKEFFKDENGDYLANN